VSDDEDYGRIRTVLTNLRERILAKLSKDRYLNLSCGLKRAQIQSAQQYLLNLQQ
jgi:hypothetical protein